MERYRRSMVLQACEIFCPSPEYSNYMEIESIRKKLRPRLKRSRVASSIIGISSITYVHSTSNCRFDRMNIQYQLQDRCDIEMTRDIQE